MQIFKAAITLLVVGMAPGLQAQNTPAPYPARPLTFLVGYAAGTGIDTTARFYAERLREAIGQPVIVINKAGANGDLAAMVSDEEDAVRCA